MRDDRTNKDGRFKLRWRYKKSRTNHHLFADFYLDILFPFPLSTFYFYLFSAVKQFVEFLHAQNFFLFVERKKTNETDDIAMTSNPLFLFHEMIARREIGRIPFHVTFLRSFVNNDFFDWNFRFFLSFPPPPPF